MEFAPARVSLSFEVTFDQNDLYVGMSVYDDSGTTPVLIHGPSRMLNWAGNSYRAKFTAVSGKSYLIFKAVYTNSSLNVLDDNYSQGTESIVAENLQTIDSDCEIIGYITSNSIIGYIQKNDEIIGLINC